MRIELDGPPIALLAAFGALWALDANGTLYRLEDGRVEATLDLGLRAPYNLWAGADTLWVADDQAGEVVRIDPGGAVRRADRGRRRAGGHGLRRHDGVGRQPP